VALRPLDGGRTGNINVIETSSRYHMLCPAFARHGQARAGLDKA